MKLFKISFVNASLIIFTLAIFIGSFSACKKREGYIGPKYVSAPEGFFVVDELFEPSAALANFAVGDVINFSSDFSHEVTYTVTVVGQTSGATYTTSGLAKNID